jgi:hypothetical protein
MARPLFTVIIPTKDRAQLVGEAIRSVLLQSLGDFELIVSDNWNDDRTRDVLAGFIDPRLRVIKPPRELAMPEHWEFASREAAGSYVLFLTDRMVMRPSALSIIRDRLVENGEPELCSWGLQNYFDESGTLGPNSLGGTAELLDSKTVVADFARFCWPKLQRIPRALNSCVRNEALARARARFGNVFLPMAPDFTSAFLLLSQCAHVLYLDLPLLLSRGHQQSNGRITQVEGGGRYLATLDKSHDPLSHVPMKAFTVWNAVANDFLRMQELAGDALAYAQLDLERYFAVCLEEIELMERLDPGRDRGALRTEWSRALSERGVDARRVEAQRTRPYSRAQRVKDRLRTTTMWPYLRGAKERLVALERRLRSPRFASALDAALATDRILMS